jgi:hypothetical protein
MARPWSLQANHTRRAVAVGLASETEPTRGSRDERGEAQTS